MRFRSKERGTRVKDRAEMARVKERGRGGEERKETLAEKPSLRKHPFLHALRRWGRFARNVPSGEERGETDVFAG